MVDVPIIFSAPMVQALIAGRKTMTRRPIAAGLGYTPSPWQKVKTGDRLWVRESLFESDDGRWRYSADKSAVTLPKDHPSVSAMIAWAHHKEGASAPSIHMPRWASRLTLIVTATKTEPLQNLSEADAIAEGVSRIGDDMPWATNSFKDGPNFYTVDMGDGALSQPTAAGTFALLWKCLHGEDAWGENPEVVALTVRVVKANIDAREALAKVST